MPLAGLELVRPGFSASYSELQCPLTLRARTEEGSCTIEGRAESLAGDRKELTMSERPQMFSHHKQGPVWQIVS